MLLIYSSEADSKKMSAAEGQEIFQGYMAFTQDLTKAGKNKGRAPLESSATATTVRVRNGKTVVTDGPFAETKEQLGGYYWSRRRISTIRLRLRHEFRERSTVQSRCGRSENSICRRPA